jgi:hypothetical protein
LSHATKGCASCQLTHTTGSVLCERPRDLASSHQPAHSQAGRRNNHWGLGDPPVSSGISSFTNELGVFASRHIVLSQRERSKRNRMPRRFISDRSAACSDADEPMVKSPAGITTISGHVGPLWKDLPAMVSGCGCRACAHDNVAPMRRIHEFRCVELFHLCAAMPTHSAKASGAS